MPRRSAKPSRGRRCGSRQRRASGTTPVKSAERQAALLDHKTRDFLVRQRTQLVNTIRAHLSEFGIVMAKGIHNVERLLAATDDLPATARAAVEMLATQLRETQEKIDEVTARIEAAQKTDPLAKRLATIPGVAEKGPCLVLAAAGYAHRTCGLRGREGHERAPCPATS